MNRYLLALALAASLLVGCTTPHYSGSAGKTLEHVYAADFTNTWKAAIEACRRPPLSIDYLNPTSGVIRASSQARMESWGERVEALVSSVDGGTKVAVSSKHKGPHLTFNFDWSYGILKNIAIDCGEPIPEPPSGPAEPSHSPRGVASSRTGPR